MVTKSYLRALQALAALAALGTASYTIFLRDYLDARSAPKPRTMVCASLTAYDADSMNCDGVELRLIGNGVPGISGIDTPEIEFAKCSKERALGVAARAVIRTLLPDVKQVEYSGVRDPFLRPLVRLRMRDGRLVEDVLLEQGVAVVWTPAYIPRWCHERGSGYTGIPDNSAN